MGHSPMGMEAVHQQGPFTILEDRDQELGFQISEALDQVAEPITTPEVDHTAQLQELGQVVPLP